MRRLTLILNGQTDKLLHHSISFIITMVGFIVSPVFGISLALVIGFIKEYSDKVNFNRWSWGDIFANLAGIFDATLVYYLISLNLFS